MSKTDVVMLIPPDVYSKLLFYAWKVDAEVGGLGLVTFNAEDNFIFVDDVFLIDQTVSQTECTLSSEGISKCYEELIEAGEADRIKDVTLWWHSHKTMGVFFSGTDDDTIREWPGSYLVALVINRKGEVNAQLMTKTPLMVVSDVEVIVDWVDNEHYEALEEEVEKKVHKEQLTHKTGVGQKKEDTQSYPKYYNGQDWDDEYGSWATFGNEKSTHRMTTDEWEKVQQELDEALEIEEAEIEKEYKRAISNG